MLTYQYKILDFYNIMTLQGTVNIAEAVFFEKSDPLKRKNDDADTDTETKIRLSSDSSLT